MGAQLEVRALHRCRYHRDVRARLRVGLAAEALAEAAVLAAAEGRAVRVGVGARGVRRRARERVVASLGRRLGEQLRGEHALERRQRVFARTRALERVAAGLDLALQVAGLAGHRGHVLELVVVPLHLGIGDAPVAQVGHLGGDELRAVALLVQAAHLELIVGPAPGAAAPVQAGTTDRLAGQERTQPAHRQGVLLRRVAHRHRVARGVLHHFLALHVAQLVAHLLQLEVGVGGGHLAAFERDHLQPGLGEFLREDAARPAEADDDRVDFLQFPGCHVEVSGQLMSAMPSGLVGIFRSRNLSMFCWLVAMTPGKFTSFQPALSRLPP